MTNLEKFTRWIIIPVSKLKEIPDGDGAFAALSIGCALCERFHRIETNSQDDWKDNSFIASAARELGSDEDFFAGFWDVFRNGIQHQMSPKWRKGDPARSRKPYKWAVSSKFSHVPTLRRNKANEEVICVINTHRNPTRFTRKSGVELWW